MNVTELAALVLLIVLAATAWQVAVTRRAERQAQADADETERGSQAARPALPAETDAADAQTSELEPMSKHDGDAAGTVTVAELLEREAGAGNGLFLNWPAEDNDLKDPTTAANDEWPTCVLPKVDVPLSDLTYGASDPDEQGWPDDFDAAATAADLPVRQAALSLLSDPQAFYRRGSDALKKAVLKVIFNKLYVDEEQITGHDLTDGIAALVEANISRSPRSQNDSSGSIPEGDEAAAATATDADLLGAALEGGGSSRAALVAGAGVEPATSRL